MAFENLKKAGIKILLGLIKRDFLQIKDAIKTVNGIDADDNGNIQVNTVPYAQQLESDSSRRNYELFAKRMAGGGGSIGDGDAWLMRLKGNSVHTGYEAESIAETISNESLSITIDHDTFVAAMAGSGTLTLTYSSDNSSWSENPASYGITVTGTPSNGDTITIVYTEEERGEIAVAKPKKFVATGWNLYNHTLQSAEVCKYADGYRIEGDFTALSFEPEGGGTAVTITPVDGAFDVPSDGIVYVTGGDSSTTCIFPTWEDWTETHDGDFAAYSESVVDLTDVMTAKFPYGLLKAGSVVDEIDLNLGQAISLVERMAYSAANRAAAEASGREYEFDEDYIYLARASAVVSNITINGAFTANDHGIEFFSADTDVPVDTEVLYGNNLKNKLERDVLTVSQQTLTAAQKSQVHSNLGLASLISDFYVVAEKLLIDNKTISANSYDELTIAASTIARTGYTPIGVVGYIIGLGSSSGTGSTSCTIPAIYISANKELKITVRNHSSNQAKIKIYGEILYRKVA